MRRKVVVPELSLRLSQLALRQIQKLSIPIPHINLDMKVEQNRYMYMQNHLVLLHIERFLALFLNVAD